MKFLETENQTKGINRAVYALLITVIIMFVLVIILLQLQNDESARREKLANDYHLAISNKSLELQGAIDKTRLWIRDQNAGHYNNSGGIGTEALIEIIDEGYATRDRVRSLEVEIDKLTGEIHQITSNDANAEFNTLHQILERAKAKFKKDIDMILASDTLAYENIDKAVEPLISITHQLQRLHQQSYREVRDSLVEYQSQKKKQIIFLISVLVVIGLLGVVKMLRLVDRTLAKLDATQRQLREKESRLREAQHIARMGYIEWYPITNEINCSEETYNIFGFPNDYEPTVDSITALIHPDDKERVVQATSDTVRHKEELNIEYRVIRPDNSEIFIHARGEITIDETGRVSRLLSTIRDISEPKIAEMALLNYRDHLEELVSERTKDLENLHQEFIRKDRLATLGQLTGTVSHELRNPLGAIKSALYVINKLGDKENERIQNAIIRADRSIDRCTLIIEELLDFTRVSKLIKHNTMIDEWLESVIEEQGIHPGIQIETNFSLKDLKLNIDPDRLRRAVINIIDNACQSMMNDNQLDEPVPDSRLTIKTRDRNNRIEIIVSDNGSGIPDDDIQKIFEPLFSTKIYGVGLGMPTVKQIMEQHDGNIEIDTEQGQGTSVTLWLPFNQ